MCYKSYISENILTLKNKEIVIFKNVNYLYSCTRVIIYIHDIVLNKTVLSRLKKQK